jgi:hypothetical protein
MWSYSALPGGRRLVFPKASRAKAGRPGLGESGTTNSKTVWRPGRLPVFVISTLTG